MEFPSHKRKKEIVAKSVQKCTSGEVSPANLAQFTGFSERTIGRWVKKSDATLPGKYSQISSKPATSTSKTMELNKSQQLVKNMKSKWIEFSQESVQTCEQATDQKWAL